MVAKDSKVTNVEDIIKAIEKNKEFKQLPPMIKKQIEFALKQIPSPMIQIPMVITKENDWYIATTPLFDLAAQGESEEEAIAGLKEIIDDYLTDPDTEKPKIESLINVQVHVQTVPFKLPIDNIDSGVGSSVIGQNTAITTK